MENFTIMSYVTLVLLFISSNLVFVILSKFIRNSFPISVYWSALQIVPSPTILDISTKTLWFYTSAICVRHKKKMNLLNYPTLSKVFAAVFQTVIRKFSRYIRKGSNTSLLTWNDSWNSVSLKINPGRRHPLLCE